MILVSTMIIKKLQRLQLLSALSLLFLNSAQGKFLVPITISLGFGVLISAAAVLCVIPRLRLVAKDLIYIYVKTFHKKTT